MASMVYLSDEEEHEIVREAQRLYNEDNGGASITGRASITGHIVALTQERFAKANGLDAQDAARWRVLCRNFGNERDESTPGKQHDILIRLNAEGCEVLNPDGSLNFAATLAAIMDDEARIQAAAAGVASTTEPDICYVLRYALDCIKASTEYEIGNPAFEYSEQLLTNTLKARSSGVAGAINDQQKMRAEFWAWVNEQGCDTHGAWSAWQAAWDRRR